MCGIAGIFNPDTLVKNPVYDLKNMLARINYRGPDESGIYYDDNIALGNVRLSIIDLSRGQQPLSTPDNNLWIVFNGEIFNYIELKRDLQKSGHVFHTNSDTEVLIHAYQEYGANCLKMLNGQFAFAIWDSKNMELFLARDRIGIRPLFYTWSKNTFVFGSEIKTIFEYPGIKPVIDYLALSQIFTFWTTLTPNTVFQNIYELPPGHYIKITRKDFMIHQWWQLSFPSMESGYFTGSFNDAVEEFTHLLTDAVRLRLRADVPVAAYLSGGLDSSAITAIIKKVAPETLQTFSIRFEDSEFDETSYQQQVSRFLNTRHIPIICTREDIGQFFLQVIWHSELPILRTAPVPMFRLSGKVRENKIKVIITGEGADEMLAGYGIFKETMIREFWSKYPDSKIRPLLLSKLYPYLEQFQGRNRNLLKFFFGYKLEDIESPFYSHLLRWHNANHLLNYFSTELKSVIRKYDPLQDLNHFVPPNFNYWGRLEKAQWLETAIFMSGYLLSSQGDRVAMANSVEGRYPFLDHRIIEFTSTLPPNFKLHGLNEKYILKEVMKDKLPEDILKRSKQAYRAPSAKSFFSSSHLTYVNDLLSEKDLLMTGLFNPLVVRQLYNKINGNQIITEIDNMALTGILSTQLLYHQYIASDQYKPEKSKLINCKRIINHSTIQTA